MNPFLVVAGVMAAIAVVGGGVHVWERRIDAAWARFAAEHGYAFEGGNGEALVQRAPPGVRTGRHRVSRVINGQFRGLEFAAFVLVRNPGDDDESARWVLRIEVPGTAPSFALLHRRWEPWLSVQRRVRPGRAEVVAPFGEALTAVEYRDWSVIDEGWELWALDHDGALGWLGPEARNRLAGIIGLTVTSAYGEGRSLYFVASAGAHSGPDHIQRMLDGCEPFVQLLVATLPPQAARATPHPGRLPEYGPEPRQVESG